MMCVGAGIIIVPALSLFLMVFVSGFAQGAGMVAVFFVVIGRWVMLAAVILIVAGYLLLIMSRIMSRPGTLLQKWTPTLKIGGYIVIGYLLILFFSWLSSIDFGNTPINIGP